MTSQPRSVPQVQPRFCRPILPSPWRPILWCNDMLAPGIWEDWEKALECEAWHSLGILSGP
jgi:hypothetical protein